MRCILVQIMRSFTRGQTNATKHFVLSHPCVPQLVQVTRGYIVFFTLMSLFFLLFYATFKILNAKSKKFSFSSFVFVIFGTFVFVSSGKKDFRFRETEF